MRLRKRSGFRRGSEAEKSSSAVWGDAVLLFLMPPGSGGGVLYQWRRTLVEAEAKMEVGANYEEVKQREDKHDKTKLTPFLFMRA